MKSKGASGDGIAIRSMRRDDIAFAMEVKRLAGWNQTERDWAGYLQLEPGGCFVAEIAGEKAGTATAIGYDRRFGWVGMVLVHPTARRRGVGTRLLQHAVEYLRGRGIVGVKLDATPMGREVYLQRGFEDEYPVSRYEGRVPAAAETPGSAVQRLAERDLPELAATDAMAFGAERSRVLRVLSARDPELCFVHRVAGEAKGHLIARHGHEAVQVGPWVATEPDAARELWHAFLQRVPGERVLVDVPHPNGAAVELMREAGFVVQRGFTRMFLGENMHPGRPELIFGTSSAEKG